MPASERLDDKKLVVTCKADPVTRVESNLAPFHLAHYNAAACVGSACTLNQQRIAELHTPRLAGPLTVGRSDIPMIDFGLRKYRQWARMGGRHQCSD